MAKVVSAKAWCNNEVAYLAWAADGRIDGCLGFMVTRIDLDSGERRLLPAWVAFDTQSNPGWEEQDTSVWPIQKFSWRDLTLRRSRNSLDIRQPLRAKYEIVPVGSPAPGRAPVPPSPTAQPGKYRGTPVPLFICGDALETNEISVTERFGDVTATFNNGILSTQNLRKQLKTPSGRAPTQQQLKSHIENPADELRRFLAGDVLPALKSLFDRAKEVDGTVHLALYELDDRELVDLLVANQERLQLILTTAGSGPAKANGTGGRSRRAAALAMRAPARKVAKKRAAPNKPAAKAKKKTAAKSTARTAARATPRSTRQTIWDTTNAAARATLSALMGDRLHNRMFNNSEHIGHNKFAVLLDNSGKPIAVWTGSTNWTPTGLCAQSNNTIIVDSADVAQAYLAYWQRLHDDELPLPDPLNAPLASTQGKALRTANTEPAQASLDTGKTQVEMWYSPNTPATGTAQTRTVPPDLAYVFSLMKQAKDAIFFLVFNPGRSDPDGTDVNTIVSAAIEFGRLDPRLTVFGAISDPTAMPGYQPPPRGQARDKNAPRIPLPAIFQPEGTRNVLMIRAAAINDLVGNFERELLSAGHAIIHDKIVVIDPLSAEDCVVITGSHNLGFKASYANDENLLVLRGNQALALAYTVHVLDIYDHYRFRAVLEEQDREAMLAGKPQPARPTGKGFLQTKDTWQDPYLAGHKGQELAYFLR